MNPQPDDAWKFNWQTLQSRFEPVTPCARLTRELPTDFRVTEVPAYPPSGSGDHVMLQVEKTQISTLEVARRLAALVGAKDRDVGFAGRKDVHAVAVQWFTVPRTKAPRLEGDVAPGIRVLRASLHRNKLQLGHLHGNTFDILLRQPVEGALAALQSRLPLVESGVPNYFGQQRFGVDGRNVVDGIRVLSGARRGGDPRGLQLLISAVQSHIFNRVAAFRLEQDRDVLPMEGDILVKIPSGAPFWCDDPHVDAERVQKRQVAVTGPLPGSRMRHPRGTPLTWESRILAEVLPDPTQLTTGGRAPVGDRRAILMYPKDLAVLGVPEGIRVTMTLPPGSFATSVLREWAGITNDHADLPRGDES